MSESVCLECGWEMEYDWAPCPKCGWTAPAAWEDGAEEPEEGTPASRHAVLSSPKKWIKASAWILLAATVFLLFFLILP